MDIMRHRYVKPDTLWSSHCQRTFTRVGIWKSKDVVTDDFGAEIGDNFGSLQAAPIRTVQIVSELILISDGSTAYSIQVKGCKGDIVSV